MSLRRLCLFLTRKECTLRELKSVIGRLQFGSYIITAGRCVLRRLHKLTIGSTRSNRKIVISEDMWKDITVWHHFLVNFHPLGPDLIFETFSPR